MIFPQICVILSERSESKDLRPIDSAKQAFGAKIPRRGFNVGLPLAIIYLQSLRYARDDT